MKIENNWEFINSIALDQDQNDKIKEGNGRHTFVSIDNINWYSKRECFGPAHHLKKPFFFIARKYFFEAIINLVKRSHFQYGQICLEKEVQKIGLGLSGNN